MIHWLTPMASRLPPPFGAKGEAFHTNVHWERDFTPNSLRHCVHGFQPPRGGGSPLATSVSWWVWR